MSLPVAPPALLAIRLDTTGQPWRLPLQADRYVELINLPVARHADEAGVPFSFAALPGFYINELLQAARPWQGGRHLLVLNPAWELDLEVLQAALADWHDAHANPAVFQSAARPPTATGGRADVIILQGRGQQVLGYLFAPAWQHHLPSTILQDLSGFCASTDQQLLQAAGAHARLHRLPLWASPHAAYMLASYPSIEGFALHGAQARIRALQAQAGGGTWAVITHHAGDLLLALKVLARHRQTINGVVVHETYADIAQDVLPGLPLNTVSGPVQARGQLASWAHPLHDELLYFERHVLPQMPQDVGIRMIRPVRNYTDARWPLQAQMAVVLAGAEAVANWPVPRVYLPDPARLPQRYQPNAPKARLQGSASLPPLAGRRVLVHLDGGWPLKLLPQAQQAELFTGLQALGCHISAMGRPSASTQQLAHVEWHRFTSLAQLRALMQQHDLLIGMDSFPSHYAALHLNQPVLCLFGPTSQAHLAHAAPHYVATSRQLACSPCAGYNTCPEYGGPACHNFTDVPTLLNMVASALPPAAPASPTGSTTGHPLP